ncbi:MAG TPA: FRG domain-containing protein [Polyangiaceae bacterium]
MRPLFEEGPTGLLSFPLDAAALIFVALAQHNGVPTRLLDWTRAGLNAAYFAATGAAKHATEKKERVEALSIWALRTNFAGWADQNLGQQNSPYAPGLRVVTAPRASNPNLHAQAGVFTESWSAIVAPLEAIVGDLLVRLARDSSAPWPPAQPPLVRFDLPTAQAPRLLRLLAYEQVDAARMFPGLGGVVAAIQEQSLWDRP